MSATLHCAHRIWDGWGGRQCSKHGKVEREGKHYCFIHDPVRIQEKNAAQSKQWAAERAAAKVRGDAEDAAKAELQRRAACFDDLLAALGDAYDGLRGITLDVELLNRLERVIKNAKPHIANDFLADQPESELGK